jgi:D-arabinose 1-dehydrogenase-like Zn-dependent alcohol dehydrogenase
MTDKPLVTDAYGVKEVHGKVEPMRITLPPLTSTQVQLEMTHCGLCHTDIHMIHNDWGISDFPIVPGHEGVGKVVALGSNVRGLALGDLVGVGWIRDSCGHCDYCGVGRENYCQEGYKGTYLGVSAADGLWGKKGNELFGCWSRIMRIEEKARAALKCSTPATARPRARLPAPARQLTSRAPTHAFRLRARAAHAIGCDQFAFKLPPNVAPEVAGPLMCAGGTVFEPIVQYVTSGTLVGVGAIGGLGTLAVKLCKLYGATVRAAGPGCQRCAAARALCSDPALTRAPAARVRSPSSRARRWSRSAPPTARRRRWS